MIKKDTGRLDFEGDALTLERLVRALNPAPCAYTHLDGKKMKVWMARALEETEEGTPGTVTAAGPEGIRVLCGRGSLLLTQVQLEGKKQMPAADFLRGYPLKPGTVLQG